MSPTSSPLPPPRLILTSHDPSGTSIFANDTQIPQFSPFGPSGSSFATFHSSPKVPVSNSSAPPPPTETTLPRCPPSGVLFCTTDIAPNHSAPMHRTLSIDYACVVSGEIVLRLDGGEEKTVRAGEYIVNRGVNHEWINRTDQWTRLVFVMIGAEKVRTEDGARELEATVFGRPPTKE